MRSLRLGSLLALALGAACSTVKPGANSVVPTVEEAAGKSPTQELVYLVPLDEAMKVAREVLEKHRFDVVDKPGGHELFTSAHTNGAPIYGQRRYSRYYVKGEALGPMQSLVRVFRLEYHESDERIEDGFQTREENDVALGGLAEESPLGIAPNIEAKEGDPIDWNRKGLSRGMPPNLPMTAPQWLQAGNFELERNRATRGYREMVLEREITTALEAAPSLEVVGASPSTRPTSLVLNAENGVTLAGECTAAPPGAKPLLAAGSTVLLADPIGTQELPRAAEGMMCEAARSGVPVVLGLSLPAEEQPQLDRFLESNGDSDALGHLLSDGTFWRRAWQDGRSSRAVLALIERARRLRGEGHSVRLIAFDTNSSTGAARDTAMAYRLLAARSAAPKALMVALAGDAHARPKIGASWDSGLRPLGALLAEKLPDLRVLDVGFFRGTQYVCRANVRKELECRTFMRSPTRQNLHSLDAPDGVALFPQPNADGFAGRLNVGQLHASPPALNSSETRTAARAETPAKPAAAGGANGRGTPGK
jgi:hypothetical protein